MAHEIHEHDTMFSAKLTPWHSLGTVTADVLDLDTALVTAGLDWTVSKHPAFTRLRDLGWTEAIEKLVLAKQKLPSGTLGDLLIEIGFDLPIEDTFATVRDDINYPLGTVGKDYTVFQNVDHFGLAKVLMDGGDIKAETAGSLKNGRVVWLLCKLDKDMMIGGDQHVPYLLFTSSHDGSAKIRVMPTPVRVVCNNTLRWALEGAKTSWTAAHTSGVKARVNEARETLNLTWKFYEEFETEVAKLQDFKVDELQFESLLFNLVPNPEKKPNGEASKVASTNAANKRNKLRTIYTKSVEVGEFTGTGWGVVQAFNTYDLWQGRVHGGEGNRPEQQARRIITGDTMANTTRVREALAAIA